MKSSLSSSIFIAALICSGRAFAQQPRAQAPKPPEISRDLETLPPPVRRMRSLLLEALRSGDMQSLKQPIETNEMPPSFTRNSARTTAKAPTMANELIKLFAERSGDGQGRETMGQLTNAFAVGHARINAGTVQEMFVWPYFAVLDPRLLTPQQEVDVYRLHSAYALREWREKGRYPGWRIGIAPDGTWHYLHGAE
jgi:hypothetical protein